MTLRTPKLALGLSACLILSRWGSGAPSAWAEEPASQSPIAESSEQPDDTTLPLLTPDNLPLQFPAPAVASGSADDVDSPSPPAESPGLIDRLRETIGASPVFEESGARESLLDSLDAAQVELSRVKRDNRRALREANRQVPVGRGGRSPHLVLITIGDVAYADLGCYGGRAATPHLDAFAAQGMRFRCFYAASTNARAARWSLLTGLNVGHAPVQKNGDTAERFTLSTAQTSISDVIWEAGYSTAFVGVWRDRELPLHHGSDEWTGVIGGPELDVFPEHLYLDATKASLLANADNKDNVALADLLFDEAIVSLIRRIAEGRPCFLHLAVSPQLMPFSNSAGLSAEATTARLTELDAHVGRFLAQLDETGLANRCCIVIAGESTPQELAVASEEIPNERTGGLRTSPDGLCEGNLRVPLLVRWPERIAAGSVSNHVCAVWDLLPTLAELAAAQRKPRQLDGISLAGELTGRPQRDHALLYWEARDGGFGQAVRKGQWKGVRAPGQTSLCLYDLVADPSEQTELSAQHPDVVEQLIVRRR
jgi:hypothetical protein